MEYYFLGNNTKQGPFTFEEMQQKNLSPETLIWRSGLTNWQSLGQTEEFKALNENTPPAVPPPFPPKSWFVESILVTCLCCVPFGILGIINATKVETLYRNKAYDQAQHHSDLAKKWCLWGVGLTAGFVVLYFIALVALGVFATMMDL